MSSETTTPAANKEAPTTMTTEDAARIQSAEPQRRPADTPASPQAARPGDVAARAQSAAAKNDSDKEEQAVAVPDVGSGSKALV
ncbi:hypothetical protein PG993_004225 [Apiospora rasikravindrae]|uniref:SMP domain-containing protein n=1 Tax=Apiospora rasikravindrae TaxID=990691 RepID=A0ABR1TC78_9PEZI